MTTLYFPPKFDSGLAGAKLTFSQTGTSTLQNVYTDEALTIAHSNPVVADAAGVFAPIYLDPKLPSYRVKFTTAANVTVYQVDGVPSNQNIQQSIRMEATNPFVLLYDTDGTANSRKYRVRAAGAAFEVQAVNDAESVFTTILRYEGGVLYSNQTEVAVTASGSFIGTLTGVSSSATGTVNYRKVNNVVTMWITMGISATSNSTSLTMTGLPSEIQPVPGKIVACGGLVDNSNSQCCGEAHVILGEITFRIARTDLTANFVRNGASSFTSSGAKGLSAGWSITYATN